MFNFIHKIDKIIQVETEKCMYQQTVNTKNMYTVQSGLQGL